MATLVSPGVDVQFINESFYASAGEGTVPLIVIATASNKVSPSGDGIAPYTQPAQAGKLFIATSQRELIQNFGNPSFKSVQGTAIHGSELNEYGLHAAYQYLGISNQAYVIRADIDLDQLETSDSAPRGEPFSGTYWLDLSDTVWGIFQSNGNSVAGAAWETQPVKVAMGSNVTEDESGIYPAASYGNNGDFAIVPLTAANYSYEKINGTWYQIGSDDWKAARPTTLIGKTSPANVTVGNAIQINGITVTFTGGTLAEVISDINSAGIDDVSAESGNGALVIKNTIGGDLTVTNATGTPLDVLGITSGTKKGVQVYWTNNAQYPSGSVSGDVWVKGTSPNNGAAWKVRYYNADQGQWITVSAPFYPFNSTMNDGDPIKDAAALNAIGIPSSGAVYVGYDSVTGAQMLRRWNGSIWEGLVYEADTSAPTTAPEEGTLWFSEDYRVDIMYCDGDQWIGYKRQYPNTDPMGVIIAGSTPLTQQGGGALVSNDIWLNSSDTENYPALYRYNAETRKWSSIDVTDQTTPFGIIFGDARADSGVQFAGMANNGAYSYNSEEIEDMLISDYLDPDAPDPREYPAGMLMFNTRYSTNNVKEWKPNYFLDGGFDPNTDYTYDGYTVGSSLYEFPALDSAGRWVTVSGNRQDGAMHAGRKAQRTMVVRAMSAAVAANQDLRSDLVYYNIMAAPGYPELIDEMNMLNTDQKLVSFIIGDTPARLRPNATDIQAWAQNANGAASNGEDGLTTADEYCGIYYPWGLSTNIDGMEIMVPPSTIALRTFAYNDQVAYPWFAPAGFTRGLVDNATSVGYLTSEGEFQATLLNEGQRNVLYSNKINPIAFIPNRGLVIYGQKTLSAVDSAEDRINVARLDNYLRYRLDIMVKPFIFEQNDQQTRDSARLTVERFFTGLIGLRAIEDFVIVCDESNNTPERRNRNELWIDIAYIPLKAVEFVYIPVRLRNSGDDLSF